MSINIADAILTPSTVNTGAQFVIKIEVYDEDFEFDESATKYDVHQGFADDAQTIGGKFV